MPRQRRHFSVPPPFFLDEALFFPATCFGTFLAPGQRSGSFSRFSPPGPERIRRAGGPFGLFRKEFFERRRWIDDSGYADQVALCQFLPGPASSQVGFALGLGRAGWPGALAAWLGFTLPSALLLILFAFGIQQWRWLVQSGAVHGLKLAAVAVVAQAVWGMARTLCPDRPRAGLAIAVAGIAGLCWLQPQTQPAPTPRHRCWRSAPPSTRRARWCLAVDMWCWRCCKPAWCRQAGSRTMRSSQATAWPRPCPGRCLLLRPSSAR